ncbi:hypothetical protein BC938DRAFT_482807 [Jimgerdemannia flammicorona]|uniref:Uncharacterized protein n=1 Tax=Jimgerdemannia flammicorona TaxID=994334 RepID=A0A433QD88_9FUNG|nr:hypothetical protein BC938DRAFT_482807 [Jimgerdemannia flammicorona]
MSLLFLFPLFPLLRLAQTRVPGLFSPLLDDPGQHLEPGSSDILLEQRRIVDARDLGDPCSLNHAGDVVMQ